MLPTPIHLLLVIIMLLLLAGSLYIAQLVVHQKCFSVEETYRIEIVTGKMAKTEWLSWESREVIISSPFAYVMFGTYRPLPDADRTRHYRARLYIHPVQLGQG